MAVKIQTQYGMVDLSNDVIATVVGGAATDNYGVVGMRVKIKSEIISVKY